MLHNYWWKETNIDKISSINDVASVNNTFDDEICNTVASVNNIFDDEIVNTVVDVRPDYCEQLIAVSIYSCKSGMNNIIILLYHCYHTFSPL